MDFRCHLTQKGKEKTEAYIKELLAKRKEILDAGLDSAEDTPIPTVKDIESDISWDCTGLDYTEYVNSWGVTDNINADSPIGLTAGEDFTIFPMLSDFYKWEFCTEDDKDSMVRVEGVGELQYEMTISPEVMDDECMRVKIGEQYYYFG